MKNNWDWVENQKQTTLKGNWYWGQSTRSMWNSDIDNTLLAYQLLEKRNPADPNLFRVRNFFLEKRERNPFNTYEASRIIETLLPGLLKQKQYESRPELTINGQSIQKFPYEATMKNSSHLSLTKTGNVPVYFTAYQNKWNASPQKAEGDLMITTRWQENPTQKLTAGKPATLEVDVTVKKDAEYVMISVPVPAGCTYHTKNQNRLEGEVHREYDAHEVRIYCQQLHAGSYQYTIDLLPRYAGAYQLNPAIIEWMYFPVIFGREEVKRIEITGN